MINFIADVLMTLSKLLRYDEEVEYPKLSFIFAEKKIPECIPLILKISRIPYNEKYIENEKSSQVEEKLQCNKLPKLTINNSYPIYHSKAILRYIGKMTKFYPNKNAHDAALVDQWVELQSEFMIPLMLNMNCEKVGLNLNTEVIKEHRKWCIEKHIPKYLTFLDAELEEYEWLGSMDTPTIADFTWVETINWLISENILDISELSNKYEYLNVYLQYFEKYINDDNESDDEYDLSDCDESTTPDPREECTYDESETEYKKQN